jgi:endonuclease-8
MDGLKMVEGPTAKAYAIKINSNFGNELIREVYARTKKAYIPAEKLVGKRFLGADSLGKNILLFFNDNMTVRLHLMMFGAIHIYQITESLLKPIERVRLMVVGENRKLVVYNAPIVEINYKDRILQKLKMELGPDPLSSEWNKAKAVENILSRRERSIGIALLDQSVIAGIGNILRNEILFRAKVHPERPIANLSLQEVERIVDYTEKLSKEFLNCKLQGRGIRDLLFVYNRFNGFCKVCGAPIKFYMQKPINRKTFVCESCQK